MWEKAGVAVSVVYGSMPAESYRVAVGRDIPFEKVRGSGEGRLRGWRGWGRGCCEWPSSSCWLPAVYCGL